MLSDTIGYRYCIIDDDTVTCMSLSKLLVKHNMNNIEVFQDSNNALSWLKSTNQPPHVIICDLHMPDLNGVELMQELSKTGFKGGIVLISSAGGLLSSCMRLAQAYSLDVIGTFGKPIDTESLIYQIGEYIKGL